MTHVPNVRPGAVSGLDHELLNAESGVVEGDVPDVTTETVADLLARVEAVEDPTERKALAEQLLTDESERPEEDRKTLVAGLERIRDAADSTPSDDGGGSSGDGGASADPGATGDGNGAQNGGDGSAT